jgi:hypothetical protein
VRWIGNIYTPVPYVEHVPPDTVACIFWLKNRRSDLWRDKREQEITVTKRAEDLTDDELADVVRRGRSNGSGTGVAEPSDSSKGTAWRRSAGAIRYPRSGYSVRDRPT